MNTSLHCAKEKITSKTPRSRKRRIGRKEQDTQVLLSKKMPLTVKWRVREGARWVKEGQERGGGRASADLEGLSGRGVE